MEWNADRTGMALAYPLAYFAAVLVALAVLVWDQGYQRLHS
jgi:hypothetical protein